MKLILPIITVLLIVAVVYINFQNNDLRTQLNDSQIDNEMFIQNLRFELTGNYYFKDTVFGIELQVSDSTFQRKLIVPVNLNQEIQYQENYSDEVLSKTIRELICKK